MDYSIWKADAQGGFCTLETLENVDRSVQLNRGISRAKDWPEDACFAMKGASPKAIKLADNIGNLSGQAVISLRFKEFLLGRDLPQVEFLPVKIINHKGRAISEPYFIAQPFGLIDCIDQGKSDLMWNKLDPELICSCMKLVLEVGKIPLSSTLFRPKHLPTKIVVREDLVQAIQQQGFTGIHYTPTAKYMG